MRRSACFLASIGLGLDLNSVVAQDLFGPTPPPKKPSGTSLQYYSANGSPGEANARTAAQYQRQTPTTTNPPNYYSELFGGNENSEQQRPRLRPAVQQDVAEESSQVVQSDFRGNLNIQGSQIQQVRATRPNARPFPAGVSTPPQYPSAPKLEQTKPDLTTPISIRQTAPSIPAEAELPLINTPAGNVTFSESRPVKTGPAMAPSVVAPEIVGPQTPSVTIEWKQQSAINVGQECQCELWVKNTGQTDATGVEVQATFPQIVRLLGSTPAPTKSETFLGWQFAELKAGEEKVIQVTMIPLQRGNIATQASVRFTGTAAGSFNVSEPLLTVAVKGPEQVMVGDSTPHTITVRNPGDGVTSNVQIEAIIPEGLEHARGKRLLMEIGSLNPGETRNIRLAMIAVSGGDHKIEVQARADSGLLQQSVAAVSIIAPSLSASVDGPGLRYLGRKGKFKIKVANDGAAATSNVQMMHRIPDGFEFVEADRGVQYDKQTRLLTWFVGRLEKAESSEIELTLLAKKLGEQKLLVRATSEHGSLSDAEFVTRVEGTSSLALEVIDLDDPVELLTEAIYEVRVKNEGSAASKDVSLACDLSNGVKFVSAEGPAQHITENGTVLFRAIPELGPGKTVVFRVRVASTVAGNSRFRARLTSESVEEPLTADELTRFYGE